MNLNQRLLQLQNKMTMAEKIGASYDEIRSFERELDELIRISRWFEAECASISKVNIENDDSREIGYIEMKNRSGVDFKRFKIEIKVINNNRIINVFSTMAENWKKKKTARFYFTAQLKDGDIFSVDADSVDYEKA